MRRAMYWAVLVGLAAVSLAALHAVRGEEPAGMLGFSAAGARAQAAAEERLAAAVSAQKIGEFHRMLTREPHIAGTPAGRAMAEHIAGTLRGFGLAVEVRTYHAYLSYPRRIRLRLTKPAARGLRVTEPADPRDPDTSHAALTPGFVAYSASGRAQGRVVYVNYGLPADYDALAAAGVDARGAVVLARYGRVHRAVKVFTAQERGARGILIYSDPADDGYARGEMWPEGVWRNPAMLQRGNAKFSWHWHGDPLTPHAAAIESAARRNPADAPTLPRIPAAAISWTVAREILSRLDGAVLPGFQGALPFTYHAGPGPAEVELDVEMDAGLRPIANVVARVEGRARPERWVILGTHHDAWTFGGVDPGSAAAVVMELGRVLGELRRGGWQPERSIVLAFWDAEEYGLIGSTEFAEEFAAELRERAVAYINTDLYMAGKLEAGGAAALRDFVTDVARWARAPEGDSVYARWRADEWARLAPREKRARGGAFEVELDPLGSGADFVPFQDYLGLPTLSVEYGIEGSYGSYHSSYDTRRYMETFGDPGWRYGRALGELLGRLTMRLASAEALPLRYSHTAEKLGAYLDRLEADNADADGKPYLAELGLERVRERVAAFGRQARELESRATAALARGGLEAPKLARMNDHVARAEKSFAVATPDDGRWYRHTVYGWNIYALYTGQTLPELDRALRQRDAARFAAELKRLEQAVERATRELEAATEALE
jgi:N-acetylated-alpha-linked acidic dipeptidase